MKIDAKFFGVIVFLISQTAAGIWWAASLSSEVERIGGIQGTSIPSIEKAIRYSKTLRVMDTINERRD